MTTNNSTSNNDAAREAGQITPEIESTRPARGNLFQRALKSQVENAVNRGLYSGDAALAEKHLRTFDPYELICNWLGFDSTCRFVTIHRGRVGFSVGKPEEVRSLYRACERRGVPMTAGLKEAA